MDLSELIKCYNMEHKSLFTAFAVSFPALFTVLYLYIPEFANLEFYEQVVFSATASIFCVYISYLFTVIVYRAGREYRYFLITTAIVLIDVPLSLNSPAPISNTSPCTSSNQLRKSTHFFSEAIFQ